MTPAILLTATLGGWTMAGFADDPPSTLPKATAPAPDDGWPPRPLPDRWTTPKPEARPDPAPLKPDPPADPIPTAPVDPPAPTADASPDTDSPGWVWVTDLTPPGYRWGVIRSGRFVPIGQGVVELRGTSATIRRTP